MDIVSIVEKLGWLFIPVILFIGVVYNNLTSINLIELIINGAKRKQDRLNEIATILNGNKVVSIELVKKEIIRLNRFYLYGVSNFQLQDEIEKMVFFHYYRISNLRYFAKFNIFLRLEQNRVILDNKQIVAMNRLFYFLLFLSILLVVIGITELTNTPIKILDVISPIGNAILLFICSILIKPPSKKEIKKAQKYISDYYNSIDTD